MLWKRFVVLALILLAPPNLAAKPIRIALVIGSNAAGTHPELTDLQFADDDAAKNAELLELLGARVTLITAFDTESHHVFDERIPTPIDVTLSNVRFQTARVLQEVARLKQQHPEASVEFIFWFAGHGGASGSDTGYFLADGDFTQHDLYNMLKASQADYNHIIIDSCHAASLVSARGSSDKRSERKPEEARALPELDQWPHAPKTGYILSNGRNGQTNESADLQSGIASYEIRSALLGGADVNTDHLVTYSEIGAFASSVNADIPALAQPELLVRPPRNAPRIPLADWRNELSKIRRLVVDRSPGRHIFVLDPSGVRLAEANTDGTYRLEIVLVPRQTYILATDDKKFYRFRANPNETVELRWLVEGGAAPESVRPRGSWLGDALRHGLFRATFGWQYYLGYCRGAFGGICEPFSAKEEEGGPARTRARTAYWLLGGAAAAGLAGVSFYLASEYTYEQHQDASTASTRSMWRSRTTAYDWATTISLSLAGTTAVVGGGLLGWNLLTEKRNSALDVGFGFVTYSGRF